MTTVTLGNFFQANGKTVFGGAGGSGLDTQSLIKALTDAKALPATQLQDQITQNDKIASALSQFQTLLSAFESAADALRNPPGVNNASDNAFMFRTASVSSNTSVAGTSYMSAVVTPGASLQSYTINAITSLAAAKIQSTGDITIADQTTAAAVSDTPAAGQFKSGTFTLNGKDITLNAGDSLTTVAAKFNAASGDTGISASIIQVSTGVFKLSFSATQTGTAHDFDMHVVGAGHPNGILVDPDGVFSTGPVTISDTQAASDAVFTLNNNITITRSTNSISDAINGVTFNLLQPTPVDTTLTVAVGADTTTAQNSINTFVSAYNAIRTFFAQQTQTNSDGTFSDTAVLADNETFRSIVDNISSQVTGIVSGISGSNPNRLGDIGLSFVNQDATSSAPEVDNMLNVNDAALTSALVSNISGVANVFGFNFQSDNVNLKIFSRTNAFSADSFTITANPYATQTTSTINIATADSQIVFDTPADGQFQAGTITLNGHTVELDTGDTLNDVVQKFNDASAGTGMSAALNQVATGQYQITFTSTVNGSNNNFNLTSSAVDPSGVFDRIAVSATGSYSATYDNGSGPVTVPLDATTISNGSSYTLTGRTGTPLEGLVMVYASSLSSTINVTASQGIADKVYNLSDSAVTATTGSLAVELKSLQDSDSQLNDEIAKINQQVDDYRNQLLDKFSALEQTISQVNTLLSSLDADAAARKNA